MDALIATESALNASTLTEGAPAEEPAKSEKQVQEENKFQQAIAVWRGNYDDNRRGGIRAIFTDKGTKASISRVWCQSLILRHRTS